MQDYPFINSIDTPTRRLSDLYLYFENGPIEPYVSYDEGLGQVWFKLENVPFTAKKINKDITMFYANDDERVIGGFLGIE